MGRTTIPLIGATTCSVSTSPGRLRGAFRFSGQMSSTQATGTPPSLGWVQVVWMSVAGEPDTRVIVDVAPQLIGSGFPYVSFGVEPTMFDAPSTVQQNVEWIARTFLTASPDRLMTRVVAPVVGFRWGYTVRDGDVTVGALNPAADDDWLEARAPLAAQFPDWEFLGASERTQL